MTYLEKIQFGDSTPIAASCLAVRIALSATMRRRTTTVYNRGGCDGVT
jgi:hypothetical protein